MSKRAWIIYFSVFFYLVFFPRPSFSDHKVINMEVSNLLPPFQYSYNDRTYGFAVDIANIIFEKDRYFLNISSGNWPEVYNKLIDRKIDMTGLVAISPERKKYIYFSKPVISAKVCVFVRNDFKRSVDKSTLKRLKFGVEQKSLAESILKQKLGIFEYKTYQTIDKAIDELINNKIDAILALQEVMNYFVTKNNFHDKVRMIISGIDEVDFAFGVSKSKPYLVDYINKRLDTIIKNGVYDQIYSNYFSAHSPYFYESKNKKALYTSLYLFLILILAFSFMLFVLRTTNKRLQRRLKQHEMLSTLILDNANTMMAIIRTDGRIVDFNNYAQFLSGYKKEEVVGKNIKDILIADNCKDYFDEVLKQIKEKRIINNAEIDILTKDKQHFTIMWNNVLIDIPYIDEPLIVSTGIDITSLKMAQKMLEESYDKIQKSNQELLNTLNKLNKQEELIRQEEERYRFIVENISDGIWEYDVKSQKYNYYGELRKHFDFDKIDVQKDPFDWLNLVHKDDKFIVRDAIEEALSRRKDSFECEMRAFDKENKLKWIFMRGKLFYDDQNRPLKLIGITTDITSKKEYEQKIMHLAYYDQLTGLPNREYFKEKLSFCIDKAIENSKTGAVLYINIDDFKDINSIFGYETGDMYLQMMAKYMDDYLKTTGTKYLLSRFGGDEFIILIDEISNKNDIFNICNDIRRLFENECYMCDKDYRFSTTVSIGISFYPDDGIDAQQIMKNVDIALRQVKENGKNDFQVFLPFMLMKNIKKVEIEKDLRRAIENDEFIIHYQPIVDIKTTKIIGAEGLVRWRSKEKGLVFPMEFIPIAEQTGLIVKIGEMILQKAFADLFEWQKKGYDIRLSLNISARQFRSRGFVDDVKELMTRFETDSSKIAFEITETIAMEDIDTSLDILNTLSRYGIKFMIDDFGTGYSSLAYLKKLPIAGFKIDKSFISDLEYDADSKAIVETIILMAHKLNLYVTAEGVERKTQLEILKGFGCDFAQGYLFGKPISKEQFEKLMLSKKIDI